ncbi:MAG: NADP-dependent oxidoreductase [Vulcanimicrobiaceae bacterium]
MDERLNHQIRLAARPSGLPKESDWAHTTESVREPQNGEVLVAVAFLSLDPAMRGWMNEGKSYIPPVKIGAVMRAAGIGKVVASADPAFSPEDMVAGFFCVQEFAVVQGAGLTKLDPQIGPPTIYLIVLGATGMTAYFGLLDVGAVREGETVVVSGAAGAVGSAVGQIAKIKGCRIVGIAGGAEKCRYVRDVLGFDEAIDYKNEDVRNALRLACPAGIDVYFDNVGGDILDAALANLAMHARIVICGAISQYNSTTAVSGPTNYLSLLVNRARMQGMVVFDFADRYEAAAREIAAWLKEGRLISREDVVEGGIAAFPSALLKLFRGENLGKLVLKL